MPPLSTHRRTRRRSRRRRIVFLASVLVVVALLVGGITQIGRQSGPFYASVNRSFATQATTLVDESNATAASLRRLMKNMQSQDRLTLQADLDALVAQSDQEAAGADSLATPVSAGGVQGQFATVFAERAHAVNSVRSALDGLLGLPPLPVAGAPGAHDTLVATSARLSSAQATNRLAAAGGLLNRSDRSYRTLRQSLPRLAGHARLPSSSWVTAADVWQSGPIAARLAVVTSSAALAVTHRLVLSVVNVTPPALPPPTGVATPGLSMLSPTTKVLVQVVLSNLGSVGEPHASVQFQLTPQPRGTAVTVTRTVGLAADRSVSLSPASFKVKPGTGYQMTVAIVLPAGQTDATGTSLSEVLQIAPST